MIPSMIPPYEQRLMWFHEARFGLFIHYGLYALGGRGEWLMFRERIPPAEYAKLADDFTAEHFDADAWARLAIEAGCRYVALTARHHDGFCLYDSAVSDFKSTNCPARRDFVAEYVEAARRHGLKVGIYYSLMDWRFPGYFEPHTYPDSAAAMVQQAHDQVRELITQYGRIDVLWYDGEWISHGRVKDLDAATFWRAEELNAMVRRHQPHILINNRSGTREDLDTPEQIVRASESGRGWESCMTMSSGPGWGYIRHNPGIKTATQLLQHLCTAAAGEGNFLLNIGPRPDGTVSEPEVQRLQIMGQWLKRHGEAIYGSQRCDLPQDNEPGAHHGRCTRKGHTAYLLVFRWPGPQLVLPLVESQALGARLVGSDRPVQVQQNARGRLMLSGLPDTPPDPHISVIAIDFASVPQRVAESDKAAWLEHGLAPLAQEITA
jgi:alpha-L-fucosidase